jgi:hypothetical protein
MLASGHHSLILDQQRHGGEQREPSFQGRQQQATRRPCIGADRRHQRNRVRNQSHPCMIDIAGDIAIPAGGAAAFAPLRPAPDRGPPRT